MLDYTRLIEKLSPRPGGEDEVRMRVGVVDTVNNDGTVDLVISGVVIPDVPYLSGASVAPGGVVQVISYRGSLLIIGTVASAGVVPFTPVLTSTGTTPNLGSTGTATGWYSRTGKLVNFHQQITFNGSGVSAGTGTYEFLLPFAVDTSLTDVSVTAIVGAIVGSGFVRSNTAGNNVPVQVQLADSTHARLFTSVAGLAAVTSTTVTWTSTPSRISFYGTYPAL